MRRAARTLARYAVLALAAAWMTACAGLLGPDAPAPPACWPTFPYQQGWLGGDGAYSVVLTGTRSVWLFGDTFVGAPDQSDRAGAAFVHNTIGVSECGADGRFHIEYFWGRDAAGAPQAFVPRDGDGWWWLFGGFVHEGALYVGLLEVEHAPARGALSLPFVFTGSALGRIRDPSGDPRSWQVEVLPLTRGGHAQPLATLVPHGDHLYLFGFVESEAGRLPRILARLPLARLAGGDLAGALETLTRDGSWQPGFTPANARILMDDNATEMSVRHDPAQDRWIAVYNYPDVQGTFPKVAPSDAVYARSAPRLEGPWSQPELIFRIPELDLTRGGDPHTGCYAAKEQPQFSLPGSLTFTYVCNLFGGEGEDPYVILERLQRQMDLYRPIAASVTFPDSAPAAER